MTTLNFENLTLSQAACIERALKQWRQVQNFNQCGVASTQEEKSDALQEINLINSILYKD